MKRNPLTLLEKTLLILNTGMLITISSDLVLRFFFDISLEIGYLILPFAGTGLISLFVFFPRKKIFVGTLLAMILGSVLIFYNITKDGLSGGSMIENSAYAIRVTPYNYWIVKHYPFAEKIIAKKKLGIFFDPNSKMGFDRGYRVKVLKETPDSLYLEIDSKTHRLDSLKKSDLWGKG